MAHFGVVAPAFPSHFSALGALAAALAERGHRVTFLHRPDARAWVTDHFASERIGFHAVGAATHPPGSLQQSLRRAANPGGPLGLRRVILDMAQATDMLCAELPAALAALRIDAILGDQMEAAAGLVAEALQMPFVSVACALPVNREPGMPLPVMPFAWGSDERAQQMAEGSTRVYDWLMAPHRRIIEKRARAFGIPVRGMLHECLSPLAQVSQTVADFDFPRRALPAHFHHVGPLRHAVHHGGGHGTAAPWPAQLSNLAADRPFIFASLGTLQGQRFGLFQRIARACRQLDAQLLVAHCGGLSARQAAALEAAGATWVCAFADQQQVLARADAVVTHAGLNTVMDAIAARTPMLALPIAFDQPGAAARICHAGIGLRASPRFAGPRHLAAQLRRLLDEPGFSRRLDRMADAVAGAGGAARAADIVEQGLRLRMPSPAGVTA